MVFVNEKKFACESCIKGHRSSSCKHNDRPLFEVKKKGRPISQCERCRDLRKEKKIHSKCVCNEKPEKPQVRQLTATAKRYIALHPTLPNGLKDVLSNQSELSRPNPRAAVNTLLNPCNCKDVWNCKCGSGGSATTAGLCDGLDVLANAATLCAQYDTSSADCVVPENQSQPARSCCQSATLHTDSSKRKERSSPSPTPPPPIRHRGPSLPPIYSPPPIPTPVPEFPTIPPLSSVAALAGSGCTCGFRCTCPGCVEHRGSKHASKDHGNCGDDCSTCIDHDGGVELPVAHSHHSTQVCGHAQSSSLHHSSLSSSTSGASFLDSFFSRRPSVTLPPAPPQRARRGTLTLDPTDTTVYPSMLFAGKSKHLEERGPAFGLVSVPKLKCCAGKCGCKAGSCGCDHSCGGCPDGVANTQKHSTPPQTVGIQPPDTASAHQGCCSSKGR